MTVVCAATALSTGGLMAAELPPSGYQLLDFIESTGVQTIETGVVATSNTMVAVDFTLTERAATRYLWSTGGTPADEQADSKLRLCVYLNGSSYWACGAASVFQNNDSTGSWSMLYDEEPKNGTRVRIEVDSHNNEVRFNGNRALRLSRARNGEGLEPISVFPILSNANRIKGKLHSMRIRSAGVLQANLVPCRRVSDGALGLYDLVRETFLPNVCDAADFTAGPESSDLEFALDAVPEQGWDGSAAVTPTPAVRTVICNRTLVLGTDYALSYSDNAAAGTATVTATGLGAFAGQSASRTFRIHRTGGAFRLASWNVGHWSNGASSSSSIGATDLAKTAKYKAKIAAIDADWFGACEYSWDFMPNNQNHASWSDAAESVFQRYPSFLVGPQNDYQCNAVFHSTRFEVLESRVDAYPTHTQNTYAYGHRVLVDGLYEVWFVQTHLDWSSPSIRAPQVQWLVDTYGDKPRVVISGDFNSAGRAASALPSTTWAADYEAFAAGGFTVANPSLPTTNGGRIIDNIVVKGFRVSDVAVVPHENLSDHHAVVATLEPLDAGRIAKPVDPLAPVYDGKAHAPAIAANAAYVVTCAPQTAAGSYPVTVALVDKANTAWEDGTTDDLALTFTIAKSSNVWTTAPSLSPTHWPTGAVVTAAASAAYHGTPVANYAPADFSALLEGDYVYTVTVPEDANFLPLSTNIPFSVYSPFTATLTYENGLATGAQLVFPASTSNRVLCVFYDDVDRGATYAGWAGCARLSEVPAGTGSVTVQLPRVAGREYGCLRFAFYQDSTSYVQDGLVAQWDAYENAGRGRFDPTTKVWKDLVGSLDLAQDNWDFTSPTAVSKPDGDYRATVTATGLLPATTTKTVEVVFRTTSAFDFTQSGRTDVINLGNDGMIALRGSGGNNLLGMFTQNSNRMTPYTVDTASTFNSKSSLYKLHSYSAVFAPALADSSLRVDDALYTTGTSYSYYTGGPNAHNDDIKIGANRGPFYMSAIRIYNRALTAEERVRNYAIDQERFLSANAGVLEFSDYATTVEVPFNAELRKDGDALYADVGFSAVTNTRRKLFVALGGDRGDKLADWPNVVELATVERGVHGVRDIDLSAYRKASGMRFFLQDVYDSTTYVQDGLWAQWDGVENAGRGVHDATATSGWKDLLGNADHDLLPAGTAASMEVGDDYVMVPKGGRLLATSFDDLVKESWHTIETSAYTDNTFDFTNSGRCDFFGYRGNCMLAFRCNSDNSYFQTIFVNKANQAYYMVTTNTTLVNAQSVKSPQSYSVAYHGNNLTASNTRINGTLVIDRGWGDTAAGVYTPAGIARCYYTAQDFTEKDFFGVSPGSNSRGNFYLNSARFYTRLLSDEERAWNAHVDRCRFSGEALPESASAYIARDLGTMVIFR